MSGSSDRKKLIFPRWTNYVLPIVLIAVAAGIPYQLLLVGFALNPTTLNANYQPEQPVAYSHELHAGQMGIDCRYCHTTVEKAAFAAIPPTQTCMNCHAAVRKGANPNSEREIGKLIAAYESGQPVKWKKVHDLPDYAYFNHSIHINTGVSCVECHGRIDKMDGGRDRVQTVQPLSMGWCVQCHRAPESHIRPRDEVFDLNWGNNLAADEARQLNALGIEGESFAERAALTEEQKHKIGLALTAPGRTHPDTPFLRDAIQRTDCSSCHR